MSNQKKHTNNFKKLKGPVCGLVLRFVIPILHNIFPGIFGKVHITVFRLLIFPITSLNCAQRGLPYLITVSPVCILV